MFQPTRFENGLYAVFVYLTGLGWLGLRLDGTIRVSAMVGVILTVRVILWLRL